MNALKETLAGKTLEEAKKFDSELEKNEKSSIDKMNELIEKRTNLGNISFLHLLLPLRIKLCRYLVE